jgi:multiple sugar transport system substrate-binding protein
VDEVARKRLPNAVWLVVALAVLLVFPLAGPAQGPATVTYWTYFSDRWDLEQKLLADFKTAHPNIMVNAQLIPADQLQQKTVTAFASGTAPDVWNTAPTFYYEFVQRGDLENLTPFVQRDKVDLNTFFPNILPDLAVPTGSGKYYALPRNYVVSLLYYNKNAFEKAGIKYPDESWDWNKVPAVAQQLTVRNSDGTVAQFGFVSSPWHTMLDPLILSNGGEVLSADQKSCRLTDPVAIKTIQFMVDLVQRYKVSPNPTQLKEYIVESPDAFKAGKVAMFITGSWAITSMREIKNFEWDVAMVPKGLIKRVIYGGPDTIVMSSSAKNKDAAWELVKFLTMKTPVSWYAAGMGLVPSVTATAMGKEWLGSTPPAHTQVMLDSAKFMVGGFTPHWLEWQTAKRNILNQAFFGQRPVEAAAREACAAIDKILQGK